MTFKTVTFALASALAASGTTTFSYPAGSAKGSFIQTNGKHVLVARQPGMASGNKYEAPRDFTLTFGASSVTLNWGAGMSTLPASTVIEAQMEQSGQNGIEVNRYPASPEKMVDARTWLVNLGSPILADADGISVSASVTSGVAAVIGGALAAGGQVVFDVPRNVVGAWTNTATVTITGEDEYGNRMVETSASGTSHTGSKAFKKVTRIVPSANITGATFGSGSKLGLPVFLPSASNVHQELVDNLALNPPARVQIPFQIDATDLAAGTPQQLVTPVNGKISTLRLTVQTAIVTGGAVTVTKGAGLTVVSGITGFLGNGATVGAISHDTVATGDGTEVVIAGDPIAIVPDAAFTGGGAANGYIEINTDGVLGTITPGSIAKATATTGDVRGTYTAPAHITLDGSIGIALLLSLADPSDKGVSQYAG